MMRVFAVALVIVVLTLPNLAHSQSAPDGQESICANPSVLICDNFEARALGSGDLGRAIYKHPGWGLSTTTSLFVQSDAAFDGTKALGLAYPPLGDGVGGGAGYMDFGFPQQSTAYFRWYTKWSSDFVFSPIATKQIAVNGPGGNAIHLGHGPFGSRELTVVVQDAGGATLHQNMSPVSAENDRWYCFEFRITMNSAPGVSDGVIEGWIDDIQHWSYPNLRLKDITPLVLNDFMVTGAGFQGPTPGQYRWHDKFVVATDRIGCSSSSVTQGPRQTPPVAPTGLRVTP